MWRYGVTDVCYEKTGVVLEVCLKTIECKKCATRDAHREQDKISETEYCEKYLHHERDFMFWKFLISVKGQDIF